MKKLFFLALLLSFTSYSQDHFSGITTSKRVGVLNIGLNPSELANLKNHFEVQLFSTSLNSSNNKIGFSDIVKGNNLENILFKGTDPVNFNIDSEIIGPGFAIKLLNWGFAISSKIELVDNFELKPFLTGPIVNSHLTPVRCFISLGLPNSSVILVINLKFFC